MSQNNSADLWVQAMQNVSRQVYDLQLTEYKRLVAGTMPKKTLFTHAGEARALVTTKALATRAPAGMSATGTLTRNGWFYPNLIQMIKDVRAEYDAGLKEAKNFVEDVLDTLP